MATNFSIKNRDRLRKPSKLPLELFFSLPVAVCPPIISANVTLFMRIKKEIQSISFTEKKTNHRRSTPHNNSNHSTELCFCRDCFCAICLIDNKLLFSGTTATQSAITIVAYYLLLHYSWSTSTNFEWIHFDITLIPFPLIVTTILIAPPPSRAAYSNRWRWMKTFRSTLWKFSPASLRWCVFVQTTMTVEMESWAGVENGTIVTCITTSRTTQKQLPKKHANKQKTKIPRTSHTYRKTVEKRNETNCIVAWRMMQWHWGRQTLFGMLRSELSMRLTMPGFQFINWKLFQQCNAIRLLHAEMVNVCDETTLSSPFWIPITDWNSYSIHWRNWNAMFYGSIFFSLCSLLCCCVCVRLQPSQCLCHSRAWGTPHVNVTEENWGVHPWNTHVPKVCSVVTARWCSTGRTPT